MYNHLPRDHLETPLLSTMTTTQGPAHGRSSLLELPLEVRFNIYHQIFVPTFLSTPPPDYVGLVLSCKQMHEEFRCEAVSDIRRTVQALNSATSDGYVVAVPSSLNASLSSASVGVDTRTAPSGGKAIDISQLQDLELKPREKPARSKIPECTRLPRILRITMRFYLITLSISLRNHSTVHNTAYGHLSVHAFVWFLIDPFKKLEARLRPYRTLNCNKFIIEHDSGVGLGLTTLGSIHTDSTLWQFGQIMVDSTSGDVYERSSPQDFNGNKVRGRTWYWSSKYQAIKSTWTKKIPVTDTRHRVEDAIPEGREKPRLIAHEKESRL
jgi:hypothetical protein